MRCDANEAYGWWDMTVQAGSKCTDAHAIPNRMNRKLMMRRAGEATGECWCAVWWGPWAGLVRYDSTSRSVQVMHCGVPELQLSGKRDQWLRAVIWSVSSCSKYLWWASHQCLRLQMGAWLYLPFFCLRSCLNSGTSRDQHYKVSSMHITIFMCVKNKKGR